MDQMGVQVKEDEEYNVKIEVIGNKGDGIAKIENYTIFVPRTKVGDQVKIRIKSALPNFAFAEVIQEEKKEEQKAEEAPKDSEEPKEAQDTEDFGENKKEETSETNPD